MPGRQDPPPPEAAPARRPIPGRVWFEALPANVRGALWLVMAGLFFSAMAAFIKVAGSDIPVIEVVFVRQLVLAIVVWPLIAPDIRGAFATDNLKLHLIRIGLGVATLVAGFTATVHLPLAEVTAYGFTKSIFVTIFAILLLSEKVGPHRWGATIAGFLGVFIMLKPTGAGALYYALLAMFSAASAGLIMVLVRKLAQQEKLSTIMAYQSFGVGLMVLPAALYVWVWPSWQQAALMLLIGLGSAVGQSLTILAYRDGEAAVIAPMDYLRLIYTTAIGFLVFSEIPTSYTILGAAVIVAASLYTMHREVRLGRKPSALG